LSQLGTYRKSLQQQEMYVVRFLFVLLLFGKAMSLNMDGLVGTTTGYNRAVLWDVDGTLSDSYMLGFTSTQKVLTNNGQESITETEYHQGTKYTTPRRLAWHVTGNPDDRIGESLGREFDDLYVNLVSIDTAPLYPGILDTLKNIKKLHGTVQHGALSNACGAYVRAVLDVNFVSQLFSVGLGADEVPAAKPAPDGLFQCCDVLKLDPKHCIYIGDSPTDGQAAAAAGMPSVGVTWGSHPVESVTKAFTYTAFTVAELETYILKLLSEDVPP